MDDLTPGAAIPAKDRSDLTRLPSEGHFPEVRLVRPTDSGFVLLAAEVDLRPPFLWASRRKRRLIADARRLCQRIGQEAGIRSAVVFRALIAPPGGRGPYLRRRQKPVHVARFDVVILIETASVEAAEAFRAHALCGELEARVREAARYVYAAAAANVRRIGPVQHDRAGVFLFNFFAADRAEQNLAVWHYTAGWFQQETGLNNSTVLQPLRPDESEYTLINHCRWDRLADVLPSLLFKRSFRRYVLAHFEANATAPMPILYRLA